MNNLSAQGEEVKKKKVVMEGTEKTTKHKKREETTTHRSHDAYRPKGTWDIYYKEPPINL